MFSQFSANSFSTAPVAVRGVKRQALESVIESKKARIVEEEEEEEVIVVPEADVEVEVSTEDDEDEDEVLATRCGKKLTVLSPLGEGTFGRVMMVADEEGFKTALKMFKKEVPEAAQVWQEEIEMMRFISRHNHVNLVNLVCAGQLRESGSSLADCTDFFIQMPLLGPSLLEVVRRAERFDRDAWHVFPVAAIREVGRQIVAALSKLEELGLVHTDVKPENIFFDAANLEVGAEKAGDTPFYKLECGDLHIRVGDYGNAQRFVADQQHVEQIQTQNYRAPEVFMGLPFTATSDVWSVGCTLCEMYTGDLMFYGDNGADEEPFQFHLMLAVMEEKPTRRMWSHAKKLKSTESKILKEKARMMKKKLKKVKTFREMLRTDENEPGAGELFDAIKRMLRIDPNDRPTLKMLSKVPIFK
ncbi:unnamed protein product [Caenorhabditis sp. 36 PRJEB53466]|nr:unnamed protein product [Caenorhabditis sp. 36 PRJEB53466]